MIKLDNIASEEDNHMINIHITGDYTGKRFDIALSKLLAISRSQVQKLIRNSDICIDGEPLISSSKKILSECYVTANISSIDEYDYEVQAENITINILYEDKYIVVLNKPAGLVCHPAPGHRNGTLVNALKYHFDNNLSNIGGKYRPGIIHRLDKDTSGLMIVAKTNEAHVAFSELFAESKGKLIRRFYTCFVFGIPKEKTGTIETLITRHPINRQIYITSTDNGKKAVTLYSTESSKYYTSLSPISKINCELLTGRTHQIRVHMKYIGCPIVGDQTYNKNKIDSSLPTEIKSFGRQALHSRKIIFMHPFLNRYMEFNCDFPKEFIIFM